MLTVDIETARRFVLGKQGLWPGRRWQGIQGMEQALYVTEQLQLDPPQITTSSQDITEYSRVFDYTRGVWEDMTYQQRKFFDWAGWLPNQWASYPPGAWLCAASVMTGLITTRGLTTDPDQADAIDEMRPILRVRYPEQPRLRDDDTHTNAKLSRPQEQFAGFV